LSPVVICVGSEDTPPAEFTSGVVDSLPHLLGVLALTTTDGCCDGTEPPLAPPPLKSSWRVCQDELFDVSGDTGRTVRAGHPNRIRTKEPTLLIEKGKIRRSVFPPL